MNVIEMHGLITGKCVAGDMFVNESVPEYLIRKIANIEDQRNAALNTCSLIAEALGITGAVAGDTIARVQQLVSENAAAIEAVRIFSNATEQLTEIIGDEIGMDGVSKLLHGFSIVGSMPATTQALNEYIAGSIVVPDGYQICFVPLEQTTAFRDACTTAYEESLNGTGPCGVFMAGYRSMLSAAPKFAASLRGNN
ncbi:hypothetical protein [Yersinia mollaretii]|uniref:hypothetical protein n=1 Tax=Yersinia mollaretii TaxID=33060 RepID=UPI0021BD2EED|nr:hypothetical protein [Yersinia mollaretii]